MCGLPIHRFSIRRAFAFLIVASLPFYHSSVADEPIAEPNLRIARLVERLGSESFQDRQQASNELAKLGNQSRNQLEVAAKSDDPEIRLRRENCCGRLSFLICGFRAWSSTTLTESPPGRLSMLFADSRKIEFSLAMLTAVLKTGQPESITRPARIGR